MDIIVESGVMIPDFSKNSNPIIQNWFLSSFAELYLHGFIYETDNLKISNQDIIFDCGANLGLFSCYAASKGAKVYAFEPSSVVLPCLKQCKELYPENIFIIPCAVSNENMNEVPFVYCKNPGGSHLEVIKRKANLYDSHGTVPTLTLDFFANHYNIKPTMIKSDVEGAEILMLMGAKNILKLNKPKLAISAYHFKNDYKKIMELISSYNSTYEYSVKNKVLFGV